MKKVELSLGSGWTITVFQGRREWRAFTRDARVDWPDKDTWLDDPCPRGGKCVSTHVWTEDGSMHLLAHELIHALTYIRNKLGMDDSPLQEWLAYSLSWCLIKLGRGGK